MPTTLFLPEAIQKGVISLPVAEKPCRMATLPMRVNFNDRHSQGKFPHDVAETEHASAAISKPF
jgi:hypothetical protein